MTRLGDENGADRIIIVIDPDLEDIIPGFLDNRRKDASALQAALQANDWETMRLLGHRMKGDGGGYGFPQISAIGDVLEQAAIRRDRPAAEQHTAALANFLSHVEIVYRQ